MDTMSSKPQNSIWPAEAVASAASHVQALAAAGNDMSFYLTGYVGHSPSAQTAVILRNSSKIITGAATEITMADHANLQFAQGSFGFSFWIKTSDVSCLVIQKGDPASAEGYEISVTSTGKIKITVKDASANTATKTGLTSINTGRWHHVCILMNITTDVGWIYVDGVADHAAALDISGLVANISASGTDLTIVAASNKTCYLSTLGIYKAGTPTAATEYNSGVGRRLTSSDTYLSAGYQLNEGFGTAGYDVKGTVDALYATNALTAWAVGGPPIDNHDVNSAQNSIQAICRTGSTPVAVTFPHAIKIGRHAPLSLALSGEATVRLFGYLDHY